MVREPEDGTIEGILHDGGLFECWCGTKGVFEEMFDFSGAERGCGGSGYINCECGGDFCVCHHHGEYECPGCEDCEGGDDDDYDCYYEDELGGEA